MKITTGEVRAIAEGESDQRDNLSREQAAALVERIDSGDKALNDSGAIEFLHAGEHGPSGFYIDLAKA